MYFMPKVEIDQYVSHFCEHAQPFLHRVMNKHSVDGSGLSLLEEYMVQVAKVHGTSTCMH